MRITTTNLWNGRADAASLHRMLVTAQPDVLVAQEVGHDAAHVIGTVFAHGLVRGADDMTGRALATSVAVDVKVIHLPARPLHVAEVDGVTIVGVHLANPTDLPTGPRLRRVEVDAILDVTAGLSHVAVVGDMNASPVWPTYRRLASTLDDAVADAARRDGLRPRRTWSRSPRGPRLLRIDHVLTRGLRASGVRWDRVDGSDHLAITVTVEG